MIYGHTRLRISELKDLEDDEWSQISVSFLLVAFQPFKSEE